MRADLYDPQFEPVFMGRQDRRPRQATGGNQPAQPYAGNFPILTGGNFPAQPMPMRQTDGPSPQVPWWAQTGGVMPPMQQPQQFMGGQLPPQQFNPQPMGGNSQQAPWAGGWPRFGNFGRFGYR